MTQRPAGTANLAYESVANIVVAAHGSHEVPLEEFRAHLRWCDTQVIRGLLVRADRVALTARERAEFREFWARRQAPPFALMAGAAAPRGMLTALTWTGYEPPMRAFTLTDYTGALDFLGVLDAAERAAVLSALGRVQLFVSTDASQPPALPHSPPFDQSMVGPARLDSLRKLRVPSKV